MNEQFEAAVRQTAIDHFGYKEGDALLKSILEKRGNGTYCVEWVNGFAKGWEGRHKADAARPDHATWHQFTRGKWLVDSSDHTVCIVQDGHAFTIASVGAMDVLEIAMDDLNAKFYYGPESVANAYLMRSAPDLLRALEHLVDKVRLSQQVWISLEEPVDTAQKAINAALMRLPSTVDGDAAEFENL